MGLWLSPDQGGVVPTPSDRYEHRGSEGMQTRRMSRVAQSPAGWVLACWQLESHGKGGEAPMAPRLSGLPGGEALRLGQRLHHTWGLAMPGPEDSL